MALFRYKAIDQLSTILDGVLSARDESELEQLLAIQGLVLIETKKVWSFNTLKTPKVKLEDLSEFCYYLQLFLTSGIPLVSGLLDLINQKSKKISYIAEVLSKQIVAGLSLSAAMQRYPHLFHDFYIQMVKAGEKAGNLDKVFEHIINYIQWQIEIKKTIKQALIYPIFILSAVSGLIFLLFAFVVPKLQKVLLSLKVELPLPTRFVIGLGEFSRNYLVVIAIFVIVLFMLFKFAKKNRTGRRIIDRLILRVPMISDFVKKINYSQYFKTLSTLLGSGLNIEQTFTAAARVVTNIEIYDRLSSITDAVLTGDTITSAMTKSGLFPHFVIQMISVGEKTGNFEDIAIRIAQVFDKEVKDRIKKIFAVLEPSIIILLGFVVLVVLLSVFLPIYNMLGGIRGK